MDESLTARLAGVSKYYNSGGKGAAALKNIDFSARKGEMILLLGPSGSGKTTFLTLLAGMQRPSSGDVYLFGRRTTDYSVAELQTLRARRIGFVFQNFLLLDSFPVLQNIMMVMTFAGCGSEAARRSSLMYLERLGIGHLAGSMPSAISQGEKQRVAVARALVNGAELIIADEPTGSLASRQGMKIIELLKQSSVEESRCVIIASHDERIISFADKVIRLSDGEIV
jgi:putative ABC transport system ATP-binding protein